MSAQMFNQPDSTNWSAFWAQMPRRTNAPMGTATPAAPRAEEMPQRAEPEKAEDWAGDCLFDCYNN
jgi:hypothetical protein